MPSESLQVKLSQDSLFFPLPFTNATIDNLVEVRNPLPVVPGDPKANVIAFKILSEVQNRYSVRPSAGFIGPGTHVTIIVSFNPEQVREAKNPAERELPTEATRDAIHIDFAVVDAAYTATALAHWVPGSKASKPSREVVADASAFWKKRGPVTKNDAATLRIRLRCVFATRNNVPETLVISMKEEDGKKAAAEVNAAVPKTRPPPTSTTDPRNTAPPGAPPHRTSETPREATPRNDGAPAAPASRPTVPTTTTAAAAAAPAAAAAARAAFPPAAPAAPSPKPAVKFPASSAAGEKKKGLVSAVMHYKLSYAVVAVLLVLTFFCGIWDHSNLLTWLIAR